MRTSLWPGLLKAMQYNLNRQQPRVRLFETGQTFIQLADGLKQESRLAGVICGDLQAEQWADTARKVDFFDAKADLEAILALGGLQQVEFAKANHPALHPGQTARILKAGEPLGWIGALHPQTQKVLDIDPAVYVFEVTLKPLLDAAVPVFSSLSRFPEVRRDIALLVAHDTEVNRLISAIRSNSTEVLQEILVFDVYTGDRIDNGLKSVALGLILQGFSRTLTDEDVDSEIENIVAALNQEFGATLRE
jgi:phenylalanyl-tRNA synthetase beta chain